LHDLTSATSASCGPSAIAELLVVICCLCALHVYSTEHIYMYKPNDETTNDK